MDLVNTVFDPNLWKKNLKFHQEFDNYQNKFRCRSRVTSGSEGNFHEDLAEDLRSTFQPSLACTPVTLDFLVVPSQQEFYRSSDA